MEGVTALEMTTAGVDAFTQGRYFGSEDVCHRDNEVYFDGELDRPSLTWNARIIRVKMGHCDFLRGTVMLSATLEVPELPDHVVDDVMVHELLPRELSKQVVKGRHDAHTPAFREAERAFPRYGEAQAFLKEASRSAQPPAIVRRDSLESCGKAASQSEEARERSGFAVIAQ